MRVFLTGASGFVGRALVPTLLKSGYAVQAVVRRNPYFLLPHPRLNVITQDLTDPLKSPPGGEGVDVIIHLAQADANHHMGESYLCRVNIQSTVDLLAFGRRAKIKKFIFASTGDVYKPKYGSYTEDDPVGPSTLYGHSKLCAELLCSGFAEHFEVWVLRLFHPYGPGQTNRLIPRLVSSIKAGKPIPLNEGGHPFVSPLFIDDVVLGIDRVLHLSDPYVTINFAGSEVVSIKELALKIGEILGVCPVFEESDRKSYDLAGVNRRMRDYLEMGSGVNLADGLAISLKDASREGVH